MEAYDQFVKEIKAFSRKEQDKLYEEYKDKLIIRMSVLLHDLKPVHDAYVRAAKGGEEVFEHKHRSVLIRSYGFYQQWVNRVEWNLVKKYAKSINDSLRMFYDMRNYRVDQYDNPFVNGDMLRWRIRDRLSTEQEGKDVVLIAYSAWDLFDFYDNVGPMRRKPVIISPPISAKKPRIV